MKRIIVTILCLFFMLAADAQKKKMAEIKREAREPGDSNFVVLATGERKTIKSVKNVLTNYKVKVQFVDGTKENYAVSEIKSYQDEDAFYVYIDPFSMPLVTKDRPEKEKWEHAYRVERGKINIYHQPFRSHRIGQTESSPDMAFFMETEPGVFKQLYRDPKVLDMVAELVSKSKAATEMIEKIRNEKGVKYGGWTVEHMAEAIQLYNKDVAAGKLKD